MANIRIFPPGGDPAYIAAQSFVANGVTYQVGASGFADVPESAARIATANGWLPSFEVGPATGRPALGRQAAGRKFLDTSVGLVLEWSGYQWLDCVTGNPA